MTATIIPAWIVQARKKAWVDINNVPDSEAIEMVNEIFQKVIDVKKETNEDFIIKTAYLSTTPFGNEYTLPIDFEKMKQLSVKYSAPTDPAWVTLTVYNKKERVTNWWKLYMAIDDHTAWATFSWDSAHWVQIYEWYKVCTPKIVNYDMISDYNQVMSSWSPVFFFSSNKVLIYPWPTETVVEWVRFDYIQSIAKYTTTSDDNVVTPYIEEKFYKAIIYWVASLMREYIRDPQWHQELWLKFLDRLEEALTWWKDRFFNVQTQEIPSSIFRYMR